MAPEVNLGRLLRAAAAAALLFVFARNVGHYYSIGDDAYISFRYAHHLVDGLGPVWNPGERVEGYTNFLWVLLMAAGLRVGVTPELLSNVLGIASGLVVLGALAAFAASRTSWRDPLILVAPACLALSRTFTAWSTGGLETQLFTATVCLGLAALVRERERGGSGAPLSSLLLAVASLTRPEGILFAGVAGAFVLADTLRGRRSLRDLVAWALPYAVLVGGHLLWRRSYYGFWLPNTFYAKVGGLWWEQSLKFLGAFQDDYRIGWFLPLALLALARRRDFAHALCGAALASYLAYIVYIGGDRFEFRFLVVVLPLLYWLIAEGIGVLAVGRTTPAVQGALAGLLLLTTHFGSVRPAARVTRDDIASVQDCRRYGARRAQDGQFLRRLVDRGLLPRDLRIAVGGAGALPYYTDWYTVDLFGINDVSIAHQPLTRRGVPGHEHMASVEYLRAKQVALWDVLDGPILEADPAALRRKTANAGYTGRLRCLEVDDRYLAFATLLTDEDFERAFGRLPACALPVADR